MNILMFNYEYPPLGGGGGVVHQHIAEELAKSHRVTVVTSGFKELASFEKVRGVDIHRVRVIGRQSQSTASVISMLNYFPASLAAGQKLIDEIRPDVINTHFAVPTGPSAIILARRNRVPHILSIHGGDIYDPSKRLSPHRTPVLRRTVRWVLEHADRVVAQSRNTAENARRIYSYSRKMEIIPLGLKVPDLPPFSRGKLGLADDQIVLVTVGRLVARKANDQLIRLISWLNNSRLVLVIIGDGPERLALLNLAKRLHVEDRLLMPGFIGEEQKYQYLQAADIFVSTTSHEGFGLMYVEGMFCGLPIVTYDNGGQTDFLEDGRTGFLVRLNDQGRFQNAVEKLINDSNLRRAMGQYNRNLSQRFTIGHCAAQYESVFQEMTPFGPEVSSGIPKNRSPLSLS